MEFRFTILLLVVIVGLIDSSEYSLEELNYLKELYRLNTNKGKYFIMYYEFFRISSISIIQDTRYKIQEALFKVGLHI